MNHHSNKIFKFLLLLLITISLSVNLSSMVVANWGGDAFEEEENSSGQSRSASASATQSIESYIVSSAGHFLTGYSNFLVVLNRVETAPSAESLDYNELKPIIHQAFESMSLALENYMALETKANNTPYSQVFISRLMDYNYNAFKRQRENEGMVMDKLELYLAKGDVRGAFSNLKLDTATILFMMESVKRSIDTNNFPVIKELWRLNQAFSQAVQFGQYAAEIFYDVSQ